MQRKTLLHIVPEGWSVILGLGVAFIIVNVAFSFWAALVLLVLAVLAGAYFRDAPRSVPGEPLSVISPVDGVIIHRREGYDPYLDREAVKLTVRLDWLGAYILRSPVEGCLLEIPGDAVLKQGGVASWIRTDERDDVVIAIRHGSLFGQRPCQNSYGERLGQGRCCGYRRLAREADLYLPVNSRVDIALGDHVRAGESVLAKLVHKKKTSKSTSISKAATTATAV